MSGDDLVMSARSSRSWSRARAAPDVFDHSDRHTQEDDEYNLMWAAIERLPTYNRMRKGVMKHVDENGKIVHNEVDVPKLGLHDKKLLMETILKFVEEDNENFLKKLRERQSRFVDLFISITY